MWRQEKTSHTNWQSETYLYVATVYKHEIYFRFRRYNKHTTHFIHTIPSLVCICAVYVYLTAESELAPAETKTEVHESVCAHDQFHAACHGHRRGKIKESCNQCRCSRLDGRLHL